MRHPGTYLPIMGSLSFPRCRSRIRLLVLWLLCLFDRRSRSAHLAGSSEAQDPDDNDLITPAEFSASTSGTGAQNMKMVVSRCKMRDA
jgi:hypothetical protein